MDRALIARKTAFRAALRGWYRRHARRLPWREEPSLYRTVVSEFMLQQTQVKTALPYFARWMDALPGFAELAAAPETRVLRLWEGLGYYARARNLHLLARALAAGPAGRAVPEDAAAWRELPGIGPYTAAAITSIAFGAPEACVDGNVVRILARLTADARKFPDGAAAARAFAPLASALLPARSPGDHNQAMMELGATVCLRRNPLCGACPVRAFCAAEKLGRPADFPRLAGRAAVPVALVRVWCEHREALLLRRAGAGARRLASLYELPTPEEAGLAATGARTANLLAIKRRAITKYRITESIHRFPRPRGPLGEGLEWVPLYRLEEVALSGPHRRWVREILARAASELRAAPWNPRPPALSPGVQVPGPACAPAARSC